VLLRDETGTVTGIWRILRDQTERRAAAARMELAARVLDATQEAILVTNGDLDVVSVNPAFCDITGYTAEEIVGQSVSLLRSPQVADADYDAVYGRIMADADWQGEQPLRRRDGSSFIAALQVNSIRDLTGRVLNIVVLIRDVTADKATQARILHLARFDPLTGLPNRAYFQELVEEALQAARRRSERCALVFVDLDHFKTVNDSLGHAVGDALLKEVAARLTDAIRAGDTAGRLGGDEFVVLMRDVITPQDASLLARRVLERLAGPAEIAGNPLVVTPSLGIALFPDDGEDYDTLTRNADAAMYHAKERGRNNFQFYAAEMNARAVETLSVEAQLRGALERREFALHYQPQVDLKSGRIVGVEALLRWRHPEWGDVPPDRFIPVAEERGLIGPIGDWVLHEACRQAVAWQRAGLPPIVMAVNISAPQFYKQDLPTEVAAVLNETGLEARWLELEVTESLLMQDVEAIIPVMNALKQMGVGIGIDDFGTGYSSLGYLKRFKAGKLKIDRSFVADLPGDPDDCAITRAVIALGRSMNLKVIAEGVERPDQWAFLRDEGCDEAQGFLIARGLPPEALHAMLARGQWSGEDR
jgi:diguanylate cyclase (GGDEF)-like protein/PAS domain S-box-containing protein